jgi:hypothetical protein
MYKSLILSLVLAFAVTDAAVAQGTATPSGVVSTSNTQTRAPGQPSESAAEGPSSRGL